MADNVNVTPGTGVVIAADDIGGVVHQRVKIVIGADGVSNGDISAANPMPVLSTSPSIVSTANSSTAILGIGGVLTGASEQVQDYATIQVNVFSDQASATNGLSVQQSSNGTNWDMLDTFTVPAATGKIFSFVPAARFFRIVYTNGGVAQAAFRLQTVFHYNYTKGSTHSLAETITTQNDAGLSIAQVRGLNGTSALPLLCDASGNLLVSQIAITKGTQGAVGVTTQDLKDAGRNQVQFYMLIPVAATATDTLQSLTGTKSGATVAATTTPAVVTAGKTFRVTRLGASYIATAATGYAIVRLRFNTGGVVAITSPVSTSFAVGTSAPTTANAVDTKEVEIPDGLEFAAGTGIGFSVQGFAAVAAAASGFVIVSVTGFEY